ncbi:MAG: uroporphyrinogen decarboxylase [Gammaproteobacteria bacterium]|jgi:uroporphyrinogen decarboxylase|nr:uroporphyrinogen decarboxylase [Gammaproteobacteria bacterium]MBT4494052.1 uroporphyrinogen decarboxylase [Gammaproteobacteria bacterium]MBT7370954.1 uroporphyrinogen decarboxylase [Gammaproteobacteria bacterium]
MNDALQQSVFLKACRGEQTDYTPVWLNRQAGRYMKEYHEVKADTPSLDFFKTPHLAAQVTCDAQRILGVDAAIMFADLLPILEPMGLELDYIVGVGPNIANPVRSNADIDNLRVAPSADTMPYIGEVIRLIRAELPDDIPLIGFGGAPFTLASYAIEGKGSRNYIQVKKLMLSDPGAFRAIMEKMTTCAIDYFRYQIDEGVQAVQIFDSWVGCLSVSDYREYVFEHSRRLISEISGRVPVIHFGTGNPALLPLMAEAGGDVMALDWRAPLRESWDLMGVPAVQGNMDPVALFAKKEAMLATAGSVMKEVERRPGHIFNLGHGILPETPVDNVKALVDFVHEYQV